MANTVYKTKDNDRWDIVARKMYGTFNKVPDIQMANRNVALYIYFPMNIELTVPIIETSTAVDVMALPPWMR